MGKRLAGIVSGIILIIFTTSAVFAQGRPGGKPGQPFEVQLTPYKTTMKADGKDTCLIAVKIIDNAGNTVRSADNLVTFTAMGKGKIISIRKGNRITINAPDNGKWQ